MNHITIGMLAHVDAGKTTLSEALLYTTGTIRKLGRVDNQDAFLDNNAMERRRGITIFSKQAQIVSGDTTFTLLDTPGHIDFSAEMERTLQVLDYAILIISGADGVQSHTETLWRLLARYHIPTFIFVNKMDQPGVKKAPLLLQLKQKLNDSILDLETASEEEIALCDENLLEHFLETGELPVDALPMLVAQRKLFPCFFGSALKIDGIEPFWSAVTQYTRQPEYPTEFGAKVFKITRDAQGTRLTHLKITGGTMPARMQLTETEKINQIRVYSGEKFTPVNEAVAGMICTITGIESSQAGQSFGCDTASQVPMLEPVMTYELILPKEADPLLLLPRLKELEEEEPELHIVWNEMLSKISIQVMGAVQTEIVAAQILDRFGISVSFGPGSIVYKETIANTVEGVGHFEPLRHYAEVHLILEPGEPGTGLEYCVDCSTDALSKNWQRLILTHLYEKTHRGVLTGAAITDMRITLVGGRAHQKHTEGGDFRQATYRAIRQGLMQAQSILLEPYYEFTLSLPQANVGRAMTDFTTMGADFTLTESGANATDTATITGSVAVAALADYQLTLSAYTKGLGQLSCRMKGYAPCHNAEEVIAQKAYDPTRDSRNYADSVFCSHGSGTIIPWDEVFEHMHVESILANRIKQESADYAQYGFAADYAVKMEKQRKSSGYRPNRTVSEEPIGTDEIDAIFRETFYANSKEKDKMHQFGAKKRPADTMAKHVVYKGTETPANKGVPYLLVDGYNIIYAWDELKELAQINLDGARGRLLDILCNYQAMKKCNLIVVFDAYRVLGHDTEILDYHNIHVVYTKTAETADRYIEKFAHENGRKYYVRVATSDHMEQVIILGQGCHLVSAKEFEKEVKDTETQLREEYLNKSY